MIPVAFGLLALKCWLANQTIPNLGDATGTPASATAGSVYVSLHVSTGPGSAGAQNTNEAGAATPYARVSISRALGSWTFSTAAYPVTASPSAAVTFQTITGGSTETPGYFGVGMLVSGAGVLIFAGTINAPLVTLQPPIALSFPAGSSGITLSLQ